MEQLFRMKEEPVFTAVQWFKEGDHPNVKVLPGANHGIVLTKEGPKVVKPGQVVVKQAAGRIKVFHKKEFDKRFVPVTNQ